MGGRGYCVQEDTERYGQEEFDPEEIKTNQSNLLDDLDRKHK